MKKKTLDKEEIMIQEWLFNQAQLLKVNEDQLYRILLMVDESLKLYVERCQVWVQIVMDIQKLESKLNTKIESYGL